jgi:hypothetical protein
MISVFSTLFPSGTTLLGLFEIIIALIIGWIIISIPAWITGKIVTGGRATFGEAMLATILGPIVYVLILVAADFLLGGLIGGLGYILGFILAFIAWIWVYKSTFRTSWFGGFAIAIICILVFIVLLLITGYLFGFFRPFAPLMQRL